MVFLWFTWDDGKNHSQLHRTIRLQNPGLLRLLPNGSTLKRQDFGPPSDVCIYYMGMSENGVYPQL